MSLEMEFVLYECQSCGWVWDHLEVIYSEMLDTLVCCNCYNLVEPLGEVDYLEG